MGTEYLSLGKGLFLLGLGVLMIFGGLRTRPNTYDEILSTRWKETIDKLETSNNALISDVSKDVQRGDPETLAKIMKQLNTLSSYLDQLTITVSSDAFCRTIRVRPIMNYKYSCKRIHELIDSTKEKVSNALKIVIEATEEYKKKVISSDKESSSSSQEESEKRPTLI